MKQFGLPSQMDDLGMQAKSDVHDSPLVQSETNKWSMSAGGVSEEGGLSDSTALVLVLNLCIDFFYHSPCRDGQIVALLVWLENKIPNLKTLQKEFYNGCLWV